MIKVCTLHENRPTKHQEALVALGMQILLAGA